MAQSENTDQPNTAALAEMKTFWKLLKHRQSDFKSIFHSAKSIGKQVVRQLSMAGFRPLSPSLA